MWLANEVCSITLAGSSSWWRRGEALSQLVVEVLELKACLPAVGIKVIRFDNEISGCCCLGEVSRRDTKEELSLTMSFYFYEPLGMIFVYKNSVSDILNSIPSVTTAQRLHHITYLLR